MRVVIRTIGRWSIGIEVRSIVVGIKIWRSTWIRVLNGVVGAILPLFWCVLCVHKNYTSCWAYRVDQGVDCCLAVDVGC